MKLKKSVSLVLVVLVITISCRKQDKVQGETTKSEEIVDFKEEEMAVKDVMRAYKDAIQNLTTNGTFELFTENATVFEQGKVEGTYKNYIDNHLGPELGHFKSFTFSDYEITVQINLPYAYTTESYLYTIVLKGDEAKGIQERTIKSKGVATSILEKIDGQWKIVHSHSSFKKLNQL